MSKEIKIGLIGAGWMGKAHHHRIPQRTHDFRR